MLFLSHSRVTTDSDYLVKRYALQFSSVFEIGLSAGRPFIKHATELNLEVTMTSIYVMQKGFKAR